MKSSAQISHVQQKHEKGCVIACIAMVLGWDYDSVVSEFQNDFDKKGTNTDFAKDFICSHGFSVIEKRGTNYMDVREHNKRMLEPFAPVHIVSIQQFVDTPKHHHAFVMDAAGKTYEPGGVDVKPLYYAVQHVMGFFDDRLSTHQKRK